MHLEAQLLLTLVVAWVVFMYFKRIMKTLVRTRTYKMPVIWQDFLNLVDEFN
jgi:hypothetical protein